MIAVSPRFIKRLMSAIVIGPVALFLMIYHPVTLFIVVIPAYILAIYEWGGIVRGVTTHKTAIAVFGGAYISICFASFVAVRFVDDGGWVAILALLVLVWTSDIGAYLMGRAIGGPKLIPSISPNKTWAGLGGSMLFPIIVLMIFLVGTTMPDPDMSGFDMTFFDDSALLMWAVMTGVVVGVVAQTGDLLISYFKRRAALKDTGNLIPGHGGILDRIDSLMLVSLCTFLYFYCGI
jgi:phosphatidate cytidylyltransferase